MKLIEWLILAIHDIKECRDENAIKKINLVISILEESYENNKEE